MMILAMSDPVLLIQCCTPTRFVYSKLLYLRHVGWRNILNIAVGFIPHCVTRAMERTDAHKISTVLEREALTVLMILGVSDAVLLKVQQKCTQIRFAYLRVFNRYLRHKESQEYPSRTKWHAMHQTKYFARMRRQRELRVHDEKYLTRHRVESIVNAVVSIPLGS